MTHRGFLLPDEFDLKMMRRALRLARRSRGRVSPNPRVGAVVVSPQGEILGEGYHHHLGGDHAEVAALKSCVGRDTRGATLYVNLEPCAFSGRTPPCSEAILRAGIGRVVAAMQDPYPKVSGRGFATLRAAGVEVESGVLEREAAYLNRGFVSYHRSGRAWCAVKVALSLDGRMANSNGESKWITGYPARRLAHRLRADHDAVLVGGGTVRADDPELTVRHIKGPNPVRIILAPRGGVPEGSKIERTKSKVRTILVSGGEPARSRLDYSGYELLCIESDETGRINPEQLLKVLPDIGVLSVLIEGGSVVLSSFMQAGVVDEIWVGVAPSVVGRGMAPFERFIPESWESRPRYRVAQVRRMGEDVIIRFQRREAPSSQV